MSFSDFMRDETIFEDRLAEMVSKVRSKPNEVNAKLEGDYKGFDAEEMSLTIEFPVLEWEANYAGILHGGIICTMLDHTSGFATFCFIGNWSPTIDIDVHFLRKAQIGEVLVCKAKLEFCGSTVVQVHAELKSKNSGKVIATSLSTHLNK